MDGKDKVSSVLDKRFYIYRLEITNKSTNKETLLYEFSVFGQAVDFASSLSKELTQHDVQICECERSLNGHFKVLTCHFFSNGEIY